MTSWSRRISAASTGTGRKCSCRESLPPTPNCSFCCCAPDCTPRNTGRHGSGSARFARSTGPTGRSSTGSPPVRACWPSRWDGVERLVREEAIPRTPAFAHAEDPVGGQRGADRADLCQTVGRRLRAYVERYAAAGIRTVVLRSPCRRRPLPRSGAPTLRRSGLLSCRAPTRAGNRLAEQFGARAERDF